MIAHVMGMPVAITARGDVDPAPAFAWLRDVDRRFNPYRPLDTSHPEVREVLARCEALRVGTGGFFDPRYGGRLDPSGLVKGWAVDRALDLLDGEVCINAGGDVRVRGRWRVGIRHPLQPRRLAGVVVLEDAALATSGTYERGEHILDPHTRRPPRGLLSMTVIGEELATADAYATAAFAMGAAGPRWAAALPGHDAMAITEGEQVLATPGFLARCPGGSPAASLR